MQMTVTFGSLFSGIGGFDLGFERAGLSCTWQVEIDPWCNKVLAKHWPDVKRYGDIHLINWATVQPVDVLCGGFPCQPHSTAGKRKGSNDERDLWPEFLRAIRELRPKWVVAENVRGLLSSEDGRFFGGILRDLAGIGYDAEWQMLSAAQFGAPHLRNRVWIVAYPNNGCGKREKQTVCTGRNIIKHNGENVADTWSQSGRLSKQSRQEGVEVERSGEIGNPPGAGFSDRFYGALGGIKKGKEILQPKRSDWWAVEPDVGRVANGISSRVDRLRGLGNALVPQIAEFIGRQLLLVIEECKTA
jgi:DNA (cytosine-5)-methyltransferase 1